MGAADAQMRVSSLGECRQDHVSSGPNDGPTLGDGQLTIRPGTLRPIGRVAAGESGVLAPRSRRRLV